MSDEDKTSEEKESDAPAPKAAKAVSVAPAKKAGVKKKKKKGQVEEKKSTEDPDALMTTTLRAMEWANKRKKQLLGVLVALVAAGGVFWAWTAYRAGREEKASSFAANGAFAELVNPHTWDMAPQVASFTARRLTVYPNTDAEQKAALASYGSAHAKYPDTGPGILARLAEGGVHLDRGEWQDALDAFNEVKTSKLAPVDPEVRLRCAEGTGYAYEGMGNLPEARKAFDALANLDVSGAKPLGMYHLARIDVAENQKDAAINKLKAARDALGPATPAATPTPSASGSNVYLKKQIEGLLMQLDPTAVPKKPPMPDFQHMSQEELQQYIQQMQGGPQ